MPELLAGVATRHYVNHSVTGVLLISLPFRTMRPQLVVASASMLIAGSLQLGAQACSGTAPFSSGSARIGAGLQVNEYAKSYGVELALGSQAGPFGSATLSRVEDDNVNDAGTVSRLAIGYALNLNPTKTVQFCPEASFASQTGPNITGGATTFKTTAHVVAFGGSVGGTLPISPTLDFVPFVGAAHATTRLTLSAGGQSRSQSEYYVNLRVGAGFVVNNRLTLQPSVAIPIKGIEGSKASLQLAIAFNFGSATAKK